jgi:anaerobic ribonucleoside-triphosphate reductase activating protein
MLPERARGDRDALLSVDELADEVFATAGLEGVSFLGGEPFAQADALAALAERVRGAGLSVMVFSGFTLAELRARVDEGARRLLAATDLLVDGRYDRAQPERERRWIGSRNQVLHVLGGRPLPDAPSTPRPNSLELRYARGVLTVNGWPAAAAALERGR